ncbi:glycosyl hydrolase family 8 [soil metagenome]
MGVDRRYFCLSMAGTIASLGMVGCSRAQTPPASTPALLRWQAFKAAFVAADGRVVDTGNGGVSHSEGQSYAMMLAVVAGDRPGFDQAWQWTEANLARPDLALYAWRYDPRAATPVADRNNATDGDLMIAWALARAGDLWHDARYSDRAAAIRAAILQKLVVVRGRRRLLLPGLDGFATGTHTKLNLSYYIWSALDDCARRDGGAWRPVIADGQALLRAAQFGPNRLPTDWIDVGNDGTVSPAADKPPYFGFDAIRVPLYAVTSGRGALVKPIAAWWRGLRAKGAPIPAWIDVTTGASAPYPLSVGGMAVVDRTLGKAVTAPLSTDYYAAALQSLVPMLG